MFDVVNLIGLGAVPAHFMGGNIVLAVVPKHQFSPDRIGRYDEEPLSRRLDLLPATTGPQWREPR